MLLPFFLLRESRSQVHQEQLVPIAAVEQVGAPAPVVQLRPVELCGVQYLAVLTAGYHDGVAEHAGAVLHPGHLHGLLEDPRPGLEVEALQAAVHALVLVRAAERVQTVQAVDGLARRAHLDHVGRLGPPGVLAGVERLHRAHAGAAGAAHAPDLAIERRRRARRARDRHRLQGHPVLHAGVVGLDVAEYLRAVEPAQGVDTTVQLRGGAVAPRHVELGTWHPRAPQAVEALGLAQCLVLQVLTPEQVQARVQCLAPEVRAFGLHRHAGAPALVLHVEHLALGQMVRAVVASHGVDQREREEADPEILRLRTQGLGRRGIWGRRGLRWLPRSAPWRGCC
mmetsp:Transcript_92341/g.258021  ORF Transcript_92341/g.258021 Transcript_92341/m.258021 type:complete len:339 (+) Transcript_92341:107-1123(+)